MVVLPGIVGDLDFNSGVLSLKFARVVLDRIEGVVPHCEFKRQVGGKGLTENRAICQRASDKEFPEFHFMPPYVMWTEAALAVTFVKRPFPRWSIGIGPMCSQSHMLIQSSRPVEGPPPDVEGVMPRAGEELRVPGLDKPNGDGPVLSLPTVSVDNNAWHMPLSSDTFIAMAICHAAASRLPGQVAVLPPPWYGYSPHHMRFAGTVTLEAETFTALIKDIVASVIAHGFRRVVVMNGHGGNGALVD